MNLGRKVARVPDKPVMLFDGDCRFCGLWVRRWQQVTGDAVRYMPLQDAQVAVDFPELRRDELERAVHLVAADGSRHVVIDTRVDTFGFSRDGVILYAIRRNSARRWELAAFAVPGGRPKGIVPLDVPVSATVAGFSASPDGKTFITSVGQSLFDIWFLEGFAPPHRWFFR